jgi:hypothetical protein
MFWIAHAGRKLAALIRAFPENLPPGHVLPQPCYSLAQRTTNVGVPKCITKKSKKNRIEFHGVRPGKGKK